MQETRSQEGKRVSVLINQNASSENPGEISLTAKRGKKISPFLKTFVAPILAGFFLVSPRLTDPGSSRMMKMFLNFFFILGISP